MTINAVRVVIIITILAMLIITRKKKYFYKDAIEQQYFQITNESVIEITLLVDVVSAMLFQHSSFHAFCQSYNYRYGLINSVRDRLNAKRVAELYYAYHLIKFHGQHTGQYLVCTILIFFNTILFIVFF